MRTIFTIMKRELRAKFDSPVAYVLICLSTVALGFLVFIWDRFWPANRASVETMFTWTERCISFPIAVLTMGIMAEEKRSGTLEMLITLPVKDHEVIIGKFLGTWLVVLSLIAATLLYPVLMFKYPWHLGALDWGPVWAGYLGLFLYSGAAVALGLFISSITESQIIALFITLIILLTFHILGILGTSGLVDNQYVRSVFSFVGSDSRLLPFTKGLISVRDVIYFASITILFLMGSFRALERRKWA